MILVEMLVPGAFGRAVAAPIGARITLIDLKLWRGSALGVLAVHVHNRPDASFE